MIITRMCLGDVCRGDVCRGVSASGVGVSASWVSASGQAYIRCTESEMCHVLVAREMDVLAMTLLQDRES